MTTDIGALDDVNTAEPPMRLKLMRRWLPLTLAVMILTRLVWMQQKDRVPSDSMMTALAQIEMSRDNSSDCAIGPLAEIQFHFERLSLIRQGGELATRWIDSSLLRGYNMLLCSKGVADPYGLLRTNQWFWVVVVMFTSLLLRIATGSWTLAMISATALMSRGSLLDRINDLGGSVVVMMVAVLWFTCVVHFMRSGARGTFLASVMLSLVGGLFDKALLGLNVAFLLFALGAKAFQSLAAGVAHEAGRRVRHDRSASMRGSSNSTSERIFSWIENAVHQYAPTKESVTHSATGAGRSRLWSPMQLSFLVWGTQSIRWKRIVGMLFLAILVSAVALGIDGIRISMQTYVNEWGYWGELARQDGLIYSIRRFRPYDVHFVASCLVIIAGMMAPPAVGYPAFFESCWLLVSLMICLFFGSMLNLVVVRNYLGVWGGGGFYFPQMLYESWVYAIQTCEPLVITLGIAGLFNLIKIIIHSLRFESRQV
jgi:hypothetical protein